MRNEPNHRTAAAVAVLAILVSPALADTRIERELALGSGGKLIVDTDAGSVTVTGTDRGNARIVITSSRDDLEDRFTFGFEEEAGQAKVTGRKKGSRVTSWFNWGSSGSMHYEIEVPRGTDLDIDTSGGSIHVDRAGNARLDTSGGSIRASNVDGELLADTSGGSIDIEQVSGNAVADTSGGSINVRRVRGNVRADTSGGSIQIYDVAGDVEADTSGGSIRLNEIAGRVTADTSGGSIAAALSRGNSSGGYLSTSGGRIVIAVDPTAALDLDAAASGGSVSCDLPVTTRGAMSRTSLVGTIGGGGATLKLRASGGGVRIESL